jgi:hypothetical protein
LPGRTAEALPEQSTRIDAAAAPPPGDSAGPPPLPAPPADTEAAKLYIPKTGFANYYFNKLERDRLMDAFHHQGDFTGFQGQWTLKTGGVIGKKPTTAEISVRPPAKDQKNEQIVATVDGIDYAIDPLSTETKLSDLMQPPDSGGLLLALYQYRQLLTQGEKGFTGEFVHGGVEPFYPPSLIGSPPDYRKRVMCDVLRTREAGVSTKWYFRRSDQEKWYMPQAPTGELIGFETTVDRDEDPCEVYLSDYAQQNGGTLPGRLEVRYKDKSFAVLTNALFTMEK